MAFVEIQIPSMGEGIIEATIIRWLVKEGDQVEPDTPLVEIATDKVDSEIPAPAAGKIKKIVRHEGDIPRVGETIALLVVVGEPEESLPEIAPVSSAIFQAEENIPPMAPTPVEHQVIETVPGDSGSVYLSPFIRRLAGDLGFGAEELARIKGTAKAGRISKKDFYRYLELKRTGIYEAENHDLTTRKMSQSTETEIRNQPEFQGPHEIEKMDRMRRLIAEKMVQSKHEAPHVTSFYEADLTSLVQWRSEVKNAFQKKTGEKLTYTPLFIEALVNVLRKYPRINASTYGDQIILKKEFNIGMATALPNGNLIVPVIRQADSYSLEGLAAKVNDLSARSRDGQLLPAEITGGTFTLTNLGMFGSITGTPIINQPESAILAIGAILRKPGVVKGPFGESIGIRDVCIFSLSYDHRIIDGSLGGMFLKDFANLLENPDVTRSF